MFSSKWLKSELEPENLSKFFFPFNNIFSVLQGIEPNDDSKVVKVKKAYPAYFDSYESIGKIREYINTIDNLYCIGRNGTHSYNNMDHSILSGMICADLIKNNSHDLEKLWNVNVDKSYQEEKNE